MIEIRHQIFMKIKCRLDVYYCLTRLVCTLTEEILADLVVSLKIRQNPPKFLPAKFDFFLNRQN